MTTQETQDTDRLSKLEGAYEQINERFNDLRSEVNERFNDLREEMRQGDAALRTDMNERFNELTQGQAALRASQEAFRSEVHATLQRQTYLIIGSLGAMWASMVGGFIALFLAM